MALQQEEPPITIEIEKITKQIQNMQKNLTDRIEIREKSSKLFFDLEYKISNDLINRMEVMDKDIEAMLIYIDKQISLCELYSGELSDSNIQNIIENKDIGKDKYSYII